MAKSIGEVLARIMGWVRQDSEEAAVWVALVQVSLDCSREGLLTPSDYDHIIGALGHCQLAPTATGAWLTALRAGKQAAEKAAAKPAPTGRALSKELDAEMLKQAVDKLAALLNVPYPQRDAEWPKELWAQIRSLPRIIPGCAISSNTPDWRDGATTPADLVGRIGAALRKKSGATPGDDEK